MTCPVDGRRAAGALMKFVAVPAPVGGGPVKKLGAKQVDALLEASGYRRRSFADRNV